MVEHRRTPGSTVSVPAGWTIVLTVAALVVAAGWLGFTLIEPQTALASSQTASRSTPAPASDPTPTETAGTSVEEPTPSPTATPEPSDEPVERDAPVTVLNNTGIANLARSFVPKVTDAGWTVAGRGNWRGEIESNTVYYPDGLKDQAEQLADDVDIDRVLPSIVPMRMDRLTIILSGPQQ